MTSAHRQREVIELDEEDTPSRKRKRAGHTSSASSSSLSSPLPPPAAWSSPPPALSCPLCTYINTPGSATCAMCDSLLPLSSASSSSPSPPPSPPLSPPRSSPPSPPPPPPRRARPPPSPSLSPCPEPLIAVSSSSPPSSSSSSSSSFPSPSSSPPLVSPPLPPISFLCLPPLAFPSPLSGPLLSAARFSTAQKKGEIALLDVQISLDHRIEPQMLSSLLCLLQQLGVEYEVAQLAVAYSVEVHSSPIDYARYRARHAEWLEEVEKEKEKDRSQSSSERSPLSTLSSPLSSTLLPSVFFVYPPRLFCRDYSTGQVQAAIRTILDRRKDSSTSTASSSSSPPPSNDAALETDAPPTDTRPVSVHLFVWGLRARVGEEKAAREAARSAARDAATSDPTLPSRPRLPPLTFPFATYSALSSAMIGLWLQSDGLTHTHIESLTLNDTALALLAAIRLACSAAVKAREEEVRFQFGGLRVRKGRTAAMKGANPDVRGEEEGGGEEEDEGEEGVSSSVLLRSAEESWIHILALIRGVSEEKAAVISRAYPSMRALCDAYRAEHDKGEVDGRCQSAELLLAELQCGQRKIGEQISRRVHSTLWLP